MKALFYLFAATVLWSQTTPAGTSIKLQISGRPDSKSKPPIEVTLPNGKSVRLTDSASFSATEPGRYRVIAEPFRVAGTIVDRVLEAAPIDRVVKPAEAVTLQLVFRQRTGSGMLWAATARINEETDDFSKGTVRGLNEAELLAGGFSKPSVQMVTSPRLAGGIAGPDGSFYFVDGWEANSLMRIAPAALVAGSAKAARVSGTDARYYGLSPKGDLWELHDRVLRQLSSGSLTPTKPLAEITLLEEEDGLPSALFLFTKSGDLLLYGRERLARLAAASLAPGKRTVSRSSAAAWLTFPSGVIGHGSLDEAGNLWVPDENHQVIQIPASAIEKGGSTEGSRFEVPQSASAVRVDNQGGVWCLIRYTGELYYRKPGANSFSKQGSFGRGFDEFTQLTLNPPPVWSPLAGAPGFPKRL